MIHTIDLLAVLRALDAGQSGSGRSSGGTGEHLEVVVGAVEELQDATDEEAWQPGANRIRNPGG